MSYTLFHRPWSALQLNIYSICDVCLKQNDGYGTFPTSKYHDPFASSNFTACSTTWHGYSVSTGIQT